jgi:predicted phage-related endonuclease
MKTHDVIQGSPEWHALRTTTYNASDAPAMLGCSPYQSRNEFLARLATGIAPEVDAATQRRFDDGHRFERLARPLAEKIIGEDLYPVSGSKGFGLSKPLGASLDGSTITDEIIWEHKSLNDELRAILPEPIVGEVYDVGSAALGAKLPKVYRVQMEQQLMISGAQKVLFTASKWDGNDQLIEARHCWYQSDDALASEILAGWKQLQADIATYTPPAAAPVVVAEPVQALPAVLVQVSGEIAIKDNFKAFEIALRDFLEHRLIREPKTDQDFADLDLQINAMKGAEEALAGAEAQMLAQVQSIDQAKKTKDMLAKLVRDNRLMAEKLLATEKDRRRGEIVAGGVAEFAKHMAALNERLGKNYMPIVQADFGGVIKGMKSMTSMENAVATELARVKIAANDIADRLQKNLGYLLDHGKDYTFLFADTAQIIQKAPDDLQALVQNRITSHQQAEEKRLEAERAAIRAEEERKAQAAAQAEQDRIRTEAATKARHELLAEQAARQAQQTATTVTSAPPQEQATARVPAASGTVSAPAAAPQKPAAVTDEKPTLKLGEIGERLGFTVTSEFLATLGFKATVERNAKLYRESQWLAICEALIQHITHVAELQPA